MTGTVTPRPEPRWGAPPPPWRKYCRPDRPLLRAQREPPYRLAPHQVNTSVCDVVLTGCERGLFSKGTGYPPPGYLWPDVGHGRAGYDPDTTNQETHHARHQRTSVLNIQQ